MKNSFWGIVPALLLVAFIVLKLCKVIVWSWWWVLAPAWIPAIIVLLIAVFSFIYLCRKASKANKFRN